jgi:hypothetical protein
VPRRPAASAEARRAVSAGPITANPAHLSQQGPTPSVPIAAHSPAGFRVSSIAEIIHPQAARRTATPGAVSGPIGPLPAETVSRYVYRHAMRYVRGYVRGTTRRHPEPIVRRYVVRDAGRYVSGYVRGTIHRYAAHTIRRYVSDMACRYAVGYVCRNLARQRVAPRAVPGEWRPAGPREALRACTGSRLRVASPLATSWPARWATGGGPPCVHPGAAPCTPPFSSPGQPWGSHGDVSSCAAPG